MNIINTQERVSNIVSNNNSKKLEDFEYDEYDDMDDQNVRFEKFNKKKVSFQPAKGKKPRDSFSRYTEEY